MPASKLLTRIPSVALRHGLISKNFPAHQMIQVPTFQYVYTQSTSLSTTSSSSSSSSGDDNDDQATATASSKNWRKQQLEKLERRFQPGDWPVPKSNTIQDEEDLQPMWRDLEGRVKNRRSRTLAENKGKIGRRNVRKTDEDVWLQEGLYDDNSGDDESNNQKKN